MLSAHAGLAALVGSGDAARIYPDALPEGCDYPAVAITADSLPEYGIDNTYFGAMVTFTIAVWADTRTAATAAAKQCVASLVENGWPNSSISESFDPDFGAYAATISTTVFEPPPA